MIEYSTLNFTNRFRVNQPVVQEGEVARAWVASQDFLDELFIKRKLSVPRPIFSDVERSLGEDAVSEPFVHPQPGKGIGAPHVLGDVVVDFLQGGQVLAVDDVECLRTHVIEGLVELVVVRVVEVPTLIHHEARQHLEGTY